MANIGITRSIFPLTLDLIIAWSGSVGCPDHEPDIDSLSPFNASGEAAECILMVYRSDLADDCSVGDGNTGQVAGWLSGSIISASGGEYVSKSPSGSILFTADGVEVYVARSLHSHPHLANRFSRCCLDHNYRLDAPQLHALGLNELYQLINFSPYFAVIFPAHHSAAVKLIGQVQTKFLS